MIIIIGNQKGGAGKSTFTLLLANFLSKEMKRVVTVIDMDYQQSLVQKFEKAKLLENAEPYQVIAAGLEDFPKIKEVLAADTSQLVLIDLPGKLDDDGLIPVFGAADMVICPFAYDEFSYDSTVLFSVVLQKINPEVRIAYVPNRVKANVKYETMQDINTQLSKLGSVTAPVADRIDFQRTNTFETPPTVMPVIAPILESIWALIGKQNKPGHD